MLQSKLKRFLSFRQILAFVTLCVLVFLSQTHPLIAQSVTQGYNSDDSLQRGMLVMLKKDDSTKVTTLTTENVTKMLGVVVNPSDANITIAQASSKDYIANTGHFVVLVSDQNGHINPGDYVTVSAIAGIGMKADTSQALVLGKALASFDGKDPLSTAKIKDAKGKEEAVNIGLVQTDINITRNPSLKIDATVPSFLKKTSDAVAQKEVGANRIYIGMVMLGLTAVIAGIVLYAGVKSSITALGRNPLSRKTIVKGLVQVVITSVIIFLLGLFGVYLLLKL